MRFTVIKIAITFLLCIDSLYASNALPPCNFSTKLGYPEKDCRGEKHLSLGRKYVGEFKDWEFDGNGIIYEQDGSIYRSGIWSKGMLVKPIIDKGSTNNLVSTNGDSERFESNMKPDLGISKIKCSDLGFKSGTEGFGKCVLQLSK